MLDNLERNLDEALGGLYYSFSTALCSADDIYAELAAMVDDDALAYLQKEYGRPSLERMKVFQDVTEKIKTVKETFDKVIGREIQGRASNGLGFMGYIDKKKQEITNFFPILD